jgi:hypothetical protein
MKRLLFVHVAAVSALVASGAALGQEPPANPRASCVATITSFEATQLPPGSVGAEVSTLATSLGPGTLGRLVSDLAKVHAGSIEPCFASES